MPRPHERRPATERRGQQCVRDRQTLQVLARLQGADGEDVAPSCGPSRRAAAPPHRRPQGGRRGRRPAAPRRCGRIEAYSAAASSAVKAEIATQRDTCRRARGISRSTQRTRSAGIAADRALMIHDSQHHPPSARRRRTRRSVWLVQQHPRHRLVLLPARRRRTFRRRMIRVEERLAQGAEAGKASAPGAGSHGTRPRPSARTMSEVRILSRTTSTGEPQDRCRRCPTATRRSAGNLRRGTPTPVRASSSDSAA